MTGRFGGWVMMIGLTMFSVSSQAAPSCFGTRDLDSPDGAMSARVTRLGRGLCGESKIEIFDAEGHMLLVADYSSTSGETGEGVNKAEWSPDSQYFVFSLSRSNGSDPSHFPITVYSRKTNKVHDVELAAKSPALRVSDPEFHFVPTGIEVANGSAGKVTLPLDAK